MHSAAACSSTRTRDRLRHCCVRRHRESYARDPAISRPGTFRERQPFLILFERSIDIEPTTATPTNCGELTLARIDHHSGQLDELDVEGILAFAERVLPRAADLWLLASFRARQRFQQLFVPDGISSRKWLVRTAVTAPAFSYLRPIEAENEGLVDENSTSWNLILRWLGTVEGLRHVA